MTSWEVRNSRPYFVVLVFCCVTALLPELAPALITRDGMVWSPVRSVNYHPGDLYYYAAYVGEVIQNGLPVYSPSAAELSGRPVIETWRVVPLVLGALPSLVTEDIRLVLVIDYLFSVFLFFSLPYLVARKFIDNRWAAAGVGLATFFLTDPMWANLPIHPNGLSDALRWTGRLFVYAGNNLASLTTIGEYDFYGSTFRFVNLSLSAPILLFYFFAVLSLHLAEQNSRGRTIWLSVLALLSPVMAFSYPSHSLISYGLLGAFAIVNFWRGDRSKALAFASIAMGTLLMLLSIGYFTILSDTLNNSELWKNIFAGEKFVLRQRTFSFIAGVVLNKYLLTFIIMLLLARGNEKLQHVLYAIGIVGLPLSMVCLLDTPQLWSRFLGRGIDHIWFMFIAVCAAFAVERVRLGSIANKSVWYRRAVVGSATVVVAIAAALPAYVFSRLAAHNVSGVSRYLPAERVEGYKWIDKHLSRNATVATLNWEDITLLPIYSSATLVVGHSVLDGRSPIEELRRFVESWRFFGRSRNDLSALMEIAPGAIRDQHQLAYRGAKVPFLGELEFDGAQFMEGVLYWPYVTKVGEVPIVETDPNARTVSPEFEQLVLRLFDATEPESFLSRYSVQAIVVDARDFSAQRHMTEYVELFRNSELVIYNGIQMGK